MDKLSKIYRALKEGIISFEGSHAVHTPRSVVEEILNNIDLQGNILVLFNIEFLISLIYTHNIDPNNITFYSDHANKNEFCNRLNVKYITTLNQDMKFDVMLANPPYSSGDYLLYTSFFKQGLELASTVVMIMPTDLNSQQVRVKAHNNLVKKHMISISENVTEQFGVGIPDIRYITASKSVENEVEKYVDPLNSHPILFPERKRINPRRGIGAFSRKSNQVSNGVPVMTAIYRGNNLQWTSVKSEVAKINKKSLMSDSPYFVLVGENPSKGLFNTFIVPNDGTKWGSGIFGIEASSLEEAKKLEEWLVSETIQKEVKKMLDLKNTHTFSGPMMEKLPWYE